MKNLDGRQQSLFRPETTWAPPTELPDISQCSVVSIDTETCDPNLKNDLGSGWYRNDGKIVGISVAYPEDGRAKGLYAPFAHEGGDNLNKQNVIDWLNHFFRNFNGVLVLMECMYDLGWLSAEGVDVSRVLSGEIVIRDVLFIQALIDENRRSYNLDSIAVSHGLPSKDESLLREAASSFGVDPKSGLWKLPARYVGRYAERDAELPLIIYSKQLKIVEQDKLERVVDLEHSLVPCLMAMKKKGIRVDVSKAEEHRDVFMAEYNKTLTEIKAECGLPVEVFSAPSVAMGFNELSISYPKTKIGRPSFTDDWLSSHPSKMAKLVTHARKQQRAAVTFCEGLVLSKQFKGRVHPNFHPLRSDEGGTVSGRFSSSNPNAQQIPGRDPKMGTILRGLFLPEEGEQWSAADFSQQEPRIMVHYAEQRGCTKGAEAAERYRNDPNTDYHSMTAEMIFGPNFTKQQRFFAKTTNLGLSYSMGALKLCKQLGFPTAMKTGYDGRQYEGPGPEGEALLAKYHGAMPFVRELSTQFTNQAKMDGAIRTLAGRLCRFPFFESTSGGRAMSYDAACNLYGASGIRRAFTHTALNRKIQGGAADFSKVALRNLWRAGFTPLVMVHDEFGISVPDKKKAREAADIMRDCVKLNVPMKVDIDMGNSWGEAKPVTDD